ncbi:hypothetical protein PC110_g19830 [Phytophthora cactorum]|uniref:Uncharacterized protein n=1 Tax=Phytophthora cactorum TaxID=29920 RepID=A0A329RH96_9STRA|nr:hypothetical protein PC110_g19830 [Phytophthora cactorum]
MLGPSDREDPAEHRRLIEEERQYPKVRNEEPFSASLGNKSMTYQGYFYAWLELETVVSWMDRIMLVTDEIGFADVTLAPLEVWRIIRDKFYNNDDMIVQVASKKHILGRLYCTKTANFGHQILGRIESEPLCDVRNSPGLKFFQFHFTYYEDVVQHRVIDWAHPQLADRMRQQQTYLFFDATISDLYLTVFYVLTTGKTTVLYEHLLRFAFITTKRKRKPAHVTYDFELTVIPRSDITGQGKRDVRARVKRDCLAAGISYSKENWKRFWRYFEWTSIKKFKPEW